MTRYTFIRGLCTTVATMSLLVAGAAFAEQPTLKIGVLGALSGPGAAWGNGMLYATQLAAADVNEDGGLKVGDQRYHVKVIAYDGKYHANDAVTAANRLIYQDKVKYIIGTSGSAPELAIQPTTKKNHVITMTLAFTPKALSPDKPYTFRPVITTDQMAQPQIDWLVHKLDLKKVGGLFPNDETGQAIAKDVNAAYKHAGAKLSSVEFFSRGQMDFTPLLTKMLVSGIDAIELDGNPPETAGLIVKQARALGFKGAIIRTGGPSTPQIVKVAGKKATDGLYVHTPINPDRKEVAAYKKRLESTYDEDMNGFSPFFYDGVHMLFKAMQEAGTVDDTTKVAHKLEHMKDYSGILGQLGWTGKEKYGVTHQINAPFYIAQVEDGETQIVAKCTIEKCESL